jgi:RNA polymerase sigma-70 factor (ECF subfamily)
MERDPGAVLEELLVASAQTGSSAAFGQLVKRWTPRLHRHAYRVLRDPEAARDAVQDAWVGIARQLRSLDDPARFPGWAYAIVSRRCMDAIRRAVRDRRLAALAAREAALAGALDTRDSPEDRVDLASAIARLPIDQRLMVSLHYGEGLRLEEIATTHGLPAGTVKSRLHAARQALKELLQGADDDQG